MILSFLFLYFCFILNIFIPFNFQNNYMPTKGFIIIYLISIIFLVKLICLLIKNNNMNNDLIFSFIILWLFNLLGSVYYSIFSSYVWSFIFILCELIVQFSIVFKVKKINKIYLKYQILFIIYNLLLIFCF